MILEGVAAGFCPSPLYKPSRNAIILFSENPRGTTPLHDDFGRCMLMHVYTAHVTSAGVVSPA